MRKITSVLFFLFVTLCWNISAQDVAVFPQLGHASLVRSVAFSPDGRQIISVSSEAIILWDTATGREIRTFSGHSGEVRSGAFNPDGRQIISGSRNGTIILWDTATGREIRTFSGHSGGVSSVAFSPDGRQIISGSGDRTIKFWDTTGREIRTFSGHSDGVSSVAFSPDGRQIISGSEDRTIKLWDATGREIRTFSGHTKQVTSVVFSPDGRQIISGSQDGTIKLWDTATGREIRTFSRHLGEVISVAFSPDGRQIISGSVDGTNETIRLWETVTGREIRTFSRSWYTPWMSSVAFSPDGRQISGYWDGKIRLWETATGREIRTFSGHSTWVAFVALSSDGRQIISGHGSNILRLWDTATGREIRTFLGHPGSVSSAAFSPDGKQIISGSFDGTIRLWDTATGREIRTFLGHSGSVDSVAFSPDGRQIISGSGDRIIKLWDVATGREIRTFLGHSGSVGSVAFSPDGRQIISRSFDRTIKLWDVATGWEIRTLLGHTEYIMSVAFSPDGKQAISGSFDQTIRLWDTATGREIRAFSWHTEEYMNSVTFSPDGRQIISGHIDGTIRLRDTTTGREIAQFISFRDGEWIVITPDGFYNASPNADRHLNVRVGNNVYGIDQYRSTFYRPQIVEARLQGRPDPVQVATTIQQAGEPPVVVIRSPSNGTRVTTNQVELSVVIESRQPLRNIQFLVNGRLIGGDALRSVSNIRGAELEATGIRLTQNQNRLEFNLNLDLDSGNNRIEVIATNPHEGRDSVEVFSQQAAVQNILPNLWILSIGVNRYDSPLLSNLNYAVNDAREIVNVFKAQEGRVYNRVNSLLIADGTAVTPTRANIIDGFDFLSQAGERDIVVLFIAGHGLNDRTGNFFFMPSDASFNANGSIQASRAISWQEIHRVLNVPGQKLVFIDACHSASVSGMTRAVDNSRLVRNLGNDSTVIFASSRGDQQSQEHSELRHGVFTHAIIQGMRGEADLFNDGIVTMQTLITYVSNRVRTLTNGAQWPSNSSLGAFEDFRVARTR
jgi:WD40 repeat protein